MSVNFRGFLCWDPQLTSKVIVVDAVDQTPAVFAATHSPVTGFKQLPGSPSKAAITEEEVLTQFLKLDTGLVLVPILGESGTGKSRLVTWMHTHMPTDEKYHVVYIPRYQTDLRSVIELILAGMKGEGAVRLLDDLSTAAGSIKTTTAPDKLLDALAIGVQEEADKLAAGSQATKDRRFLADNLPYLLRDPVFRAELKSEGSAVMRLLDEAIQGRGTEDRDEPFRFSPQDLPSSVINAKKASELAQNIYGFLATNADLREAATDLLNELLERAVSSLFGLGTNRLAKVMVEVRHQLKEEGKELVLFVEDFTILQGVQTELLDALVQPAGEDLCRIRAAVAVTSGYLESVATVRTRASFFVNLDLPVGDDEAAVGSGDLDRFVGRYLNAVRLGPNRIEERWSRGPAADDVPNICLECSFREECHAAFGTDDEGRGLYPFNQPALGRAIDAVSGGDRFDPRAIVRDVLLQVLRDDASDIAKGSFPSQRFHDRFANESNVLEAQAIEDIKNSDPNHAERRTILLTYWGDAPPTPINLPTGVHEAFALPLLDLKAKLTEPKVPKPPEEPTVKVPAESAKADVQIAQLNRWGQGISKLDQELARDIRNLLLQFVEGGVLASSSASVDKSQIGPAGSVIRPASFQLANAAGSAAAPGGALTLTLEQTSENALLLQGLVQNSQFGDWDFSRGNERLVALQEAMQPLVRQAVEELEWASQTSQERLGQILALLSVTGEVTYEPHDGDSRRLFGVALAPVSPSEEGTHVSGKWKSLSDAATSDVREKLRVEVLDTYAARRGGGAPLAVDAARLFLGLEKSGNLEKLLKTDSPYKDVEKLRAQVDKTLQLAIDEEMSIAQESLAVIEELLGGTQDVKVLIDDLRGAVNASIQAGIALGNELDLHSLMDELGSADLGIIGATKELLAEPVDTFEQKMRVAARVNSGRLAHLRRTLEHLDFLVSAALDSAQVQAGALEGDDVSDLAAVEEVSSTIEDAVVALESLGAPRAI